jgi:hypothetical protein
MDVVSLRYQARPLLRSLLLAAAALCAVGPVHAATIYKWVDDQGTLHLSSEKPPPGVSYERLNVASAPSAPARKPVGGAGAAGGAGTAVSAAGRSEVLSRLRVRECVIALEALERLTNGAEPTSATELKRLKETAERNCSQDPARRREEEEMATRLRVANSPDCSEARERLLQMTAAGSTAPAEEQRTQRQFVAEHCTSPVH